MEADIRGSLVHAFYSELSVLPNTYLTRLKGFSLAYLHVILFETPQFNVDQIFCTSSLPFLYKFFRPS